MYIESKLPDLVPSFKGSTDTIVKMDSDVSIEATDSYDPADGLSEVASAELVSSACFSDLFPLRLLTISSTPSSSTLISSTPTSSSVIFVFKIGVKHF